VGANEEEVLLAMTAVNRGLAPILVDLDLGLVRDLELAGILALTVVDIDH